MNYGHSTSTSRLYAMQKNTPFEKRALFDVDFHIPTGPIMPLSGIQVQVNRLSATFKCLLKPTEGQLKALGIEQLKRERKEKH